MPRVPHHREQRDGNEQIIVDVYLSAGASVTRLFKSRPAGVTDLAVGYLGLNLLVEVKDPTAARGPAQARKLTPDQVVWHRDWRGQKAVVTGTAEALATLSWVQRAAAALAAAGCAWESA